MVKEGEIGGKKVDEDVMFEIDNSLEINPVLQALIRSNFQIYKSNSLRGSGSSF